MSLEAARSFREQVSANVQMQNNLLNDPDVDLLALGKQHGFEFTQEEGQAILAEMQDGELSDFELEWVSGGGRDFASFLNRITAGGVSPNGIASGGMK